MKVQLHPHAVQRLIERGTTEEEVVVTVREGEKFPAKFGRIGFRRNFANNREWHGRQYANKQVEAYAVEEDEKGSWLVITIIVKYF